MINNLTFPLERVQRQQAKAVSTYFQIVIKIPIVEDCDAYANLFTTNNYLWVFHLYVHVTCSIILGESTEIKMKVRLFKLLLPFIITTSSLKSLLLISKYLQVSLGKMEQLKNKIIQEFTALSHTHKQTHS